MVLLPMSDDTPNILLCHRLVRLLSIVMLLRHDLTSFPNNLEAYTHPYVELRLPRQ